MKRKNAKYIIVIFLFACLFFCFEDGYFMGDDSLFHTSTIMSLSSLHSFFPGKIIPVMNKGFGYGIHIFYPPFPHIFASFLYRIVGNISVTMIIMQFFSIFLAGVTMFFYSKSVFKDAKQALISSLLYMSMPYFFTDVFARVAFNEGFMFFILPIVFLGLYYLVEENYGKFYLYFVLGFSLAIYTHLVLTVYLVIIAILYLLFFYKKEFVKKKILSLVMASALVLGITMPFWCPLVEHYLLKEYYIFGIQYKGDNMVQTIGALFYFFPSVIYSGARNPLRFFIAPVSWIYLIFLCVYLLRVRVDKEDKKLLLYFFGVFIVCILFEVVQLFWNIVPNLLRNIQFSWRLCLFNSFCMAVLSGYGIRVWNGKFKNGIIIFTFLLLMVSNVYYVRNLNVYRKDIQYMDSSCCDVVSWKKEYLPRGAYMDMGSFAIRENKISGNHDEVIKIIDDSYFPNLSFDISRVDKDSEIEIPRIYYLGYVLRDDTGSKIDIFQSSSGLIGANIKKDGVYSLRYEGTFLFKISKFVAIICVVVIIYFKRKEI